MSPAAGIDKEEMKLEGSLSELHFKWPVPFLVSIHKSWTKLHRLQKQGKFFLNGENLDVATVVAGARYGCIPALEESQKVLSGIAKSQETLMGYLSKGYHLYAVNTGFGGNADTRTSDLYALQEALMQHTQSAVLTKADLGLGETRHAELSHHSMPSAWTRGTMIARCNANIRGHSGISRDIVDAIMALIRHDIVPVIPLRGSISASGDLMPLAYISGAIQGNPDVYVRVKEKEIKTAQAALKEYGIEPITLGPKEGIALINGTGASAAVAALVQFDAQQLAVLAQGIAATLAEALGANAEWAHPFLAEVKPHGGQIEVAQTMRGFFKGSKLITGLESVKDKFKPGLIQDRYAIRSTPQWLGPQIEDVALASSQVIVELNSTSDNPIINSRHHDIHCGANFQATAITSAVEKVRLSLQMMGKMLFAQCSELINNDLNNGLPPNLAADDPSLSFCLKGVDVNMAAYQSELAYLANPVSSHVQSAEMHNQAVNSLAFLSARYTMQAVELVALMSANSLYAACQGVDLRVMYRTFLASFETRARSLCAQFPPFHKEEVFLHHIWEAAWGRLCSDWWKTSSLDAHKRCEKAAAAFFGACGDLLEHQPAPPVLDLRVSCLNMARARLAKEMMAFYQRHRATFFDKPTTAQYLGKGTRELYNFVRIDLGVPMHRGLIEHPTPRDAEEINGCEKKTIGSWVSIIYEAVRDNRIFDRMMQTVESLGFDGFEDFNGDADYYQKHGTRADCSDCSVNK